MPYAVAALVMGAGIAWSIHLVVAPEPWEIDSAMTIAIGVLVLNIVAMANLLLGRGRWARHFAAGLVITQLLLVLVADVEPWLIAALVLSALALGGLAGPWFKGWLRERPAAGAPGPAPIALALGCFAVVPLVGIATPDGLRNAHGLAGALGILTAWGYVRGHSWALWSARIALPIALAAAAVSSPPAGAALLIAAGTALGLIAWRHDARLAIDPLPDNLPEPRRRAR